jgi:hypothetical protein
MEQFFRSYTGIFRISRQFSGTSKSEKSAIMMLNSSVYSVPDLCWNSHFVGKLPISLPLWQSYTSTLGGKLLLPQDIYPFLYDFVSGKLFLPHPEHPFGMAASFSFHNIMVTHPGHMSAASVHNTRRDRRRGEAFARVVSQWWAMSGFLGRSSQVRAAPRARSHSILAHAARLVSPMLPQ